METHPVRLSNWVVWLMMAVTTLTWSFVQPVSPYVQCSGG